MASKIAIVNKGLAHAAQSPISSLDEQSMIAEFIDTIYQTELLSALADHTWNFAREFAVLNRLVAVSVHQDTPQYQLPADHIRTVNVEVDGKPDVEFRQSRDKLLIGGAGTSSKVILEYVTSNVDETAFSPHFVEVLAMRLGARVALSVARDKELAGDLMREREQLILPRVRSIDSQQVTSRRLPRGNMKAVRRGARRG